MQIMHNVPIHKAFKEAEFACKCGTNCGYGYKHMDEALLKKLFQIRDVSGLPMRITSAYRCAKHPETIKRPTSAHSRGHAVDFSVSTSQHAYRFMAACFDAGIKRMGWNQQQKFFHIDTDPTLPQGVLFPY
jgi:uncharacterized protein YcbK (DUF882 family)